MEPCRTVTDDLVRDTHDGLLEEPVLSEGLKGAGQGLPLGVHLVDLGLRVIQVGGGRARLTDKLLQVLKHSGQHLTIFLNISMF